jgi:hypothetical protein
MLGQIKNFGAASAQLATLCTSRMGLAMVKAVRVDHRKVLGLAHDVKDLLIIA